MDGLFTCMTNVNFDGPVSYTHLDVYKRQVVQKARDEAVEAASKAAATPAGGKVIEAARGAGASAFRALRGKGKGAGKGGARG